MREANLVRMPCQSLFTSFDQVFQLPDFDIAVPATTKQHAAAGLQAPDPSTVTSDGR